MLYSIDMETIFGDGYLTTTKDLEIIMNDFKFNNREYFNKVTFYDPDSDLKDRLNNSDIIRTLAGDLFSYRLVNILNKEFSSDYEFISVNIISEGIINQSFYIFRVKNIIDCLDRDRSIYDEDGDVENAFLLEALVPRSISVFRVKGAEHLIIYTDRFFNLVKENQLNVDIYPYKP